MTKTERTQEATRMFYEICERNDFKVVDDGFGYWYVAKQGSMREKYMFQVQRRGFEIDTNFCECGLALQFAKDLAIELENIKRMFDI
tara:strand:+ start:574 stop:834 length:261 start_codon:yes stop_codon:yes gene_type:complete